MKILLALLLGIVIGIAFPKTEINNLLETEIGNSRTFKLEGNTSNSNEGIKTFRDIDGVSSVTVNNYSVITVTKEDRVSWDEIFDMVTEELEKPRN